MGTGPSKLEKDSQIIPPILHPVSVIDVDKKKKIVELAKRLRIT